MAGWSLALDRRAAEKFLFTGTYGIRRTFSAGGNYFLFTTNHL